MCAINSRMLDTLTRSSRCSSHQELTSSATSSPDSLPEPPAAPAAPLERRGPSAAAASAPSSAGPSTSQENWNRLKQPMHSSSEPSPCHGKDASSLKALVCETLIVMIHCDDMFDSGAWVVR
jgi:hypothetical protein